MPSEQFALPATIYGVAMLYRRKSNPNKYMQTVFMMTMGGRVPLTDDEACALARSRSEADWQRFKLGDLGEWEFTGASANWSVVG